MANKKGSDGRYRYRVCIGKDETGKPKYKSFYGSTCLLYTSDAADD